VRPTGPSARLWAQLALGMKISLTVTPEFSYLNL